MTTLEMILISYILLNWFLMIMFATLPRRITNKVSFLLVIVCPPLIIGFIVKLIKEKAEEIKEKKQKD